MLLPRLGVDGASGRKKCKLDDGVFVLAKVDPVEKLLELLIGIRYFS